MGLRDDSASAFNGVVMLGNHISAYDIREKRGLRFTDFNRTITDALANEAILDMQGITGPSADTMLPMESSLEYQVNGKYFATGTHFYGSKPAISESLFCFALNNFFMPLHVGTTCRIIT